MHWIIIFDLLRHIAELFFYLITGPLVTAFAIKKIREKKNPQLQMIELHHQLQQLAQHHPELLQPSQREVHQLRPPKGGRKS